MTYRIECKENLEFMKQFSDGSFSLIMTSPPYNIGKSYENKRPLDEYIEDQKHVIAECFRLLSADGSICWQVGNYVDRGEIYPLDIILYPIFKQLGLKLRNRIIWHYEHGLHCTKRLSGRHETILWWTREDYNFDVDPIRVPSKYPNKKHFKGPKKGQLSGNPLGKNPGDVWIIPNVKHNHVEKTIHPCSYPVELVERCVLSMTKPGDSVFDPYMGVGSTVVAAVKNGRHGYGCDIMQEYVDVAEERIMMLQYGQLKTRPMNTPVYQINKNDENKRDRPILD
ncbi:MAG: site-specific DNA-methyltransferase [Candidimonas sp.]